MRLVWVSLIGTLISFAAYGEESEPQPKIETIVDACVQSRSKDQICQVLTEFKEVGNDAVEAIKAYIDLSPREYALLTVANALVNQRIRIKTKSRLLSNAVEIYDIKSSSVSFSIEMNF